MKINAAIAANRFGLGARPGDLSRIEPDPAQWLLDQLQGPSRQPAELRELPATAEVLLEVQDLRREQREMRQLAEGEPAPDIVRKYGRMVRGHYVEQTQARYRNAAAWWLDVTVNAGAEQARLLDTVIEHLPALGMQPAPCAPIQTAQN